MLIVDTSVLIDFLDNRANAHTIWLDRQIVLQRIGITTLIQTEVLQGIRDESRALLLEEDLRRFEIFETGSSPLAISSARNYRALRRRGITIRSAIDSMIATFCIERGHTLLHRDRDFDAFETYLGLKAAQV